VSSFRDIALFLQLGFGSGYFPPAVPDQPNPSVSVVIVAWNSAGELRRTIPAVQAVLAQSDELVVVDNASTDDTAAVIGELAPEAKVVSLAQNAGFAAGVNRMRWGPDGALYVGEVGMAPGGWSWKDQSSGLQKLTYNGKIPFEMLAVRAMPKGFEIEFTQPLSKNVQADFRNLFIQQWWYKPTPAYGGPKMDLTDLKPSSLELSDDGKRLYVEIPGLRKENVVYFRLPINLKSASGQPLWTSEAWYTLNEIPLR